MKGAAGAGTVGIARNIRIGPYPSDAPFRNPLPTLTVRGGRGSEEVKGAADARTADVERVATWPATISRRGGGTAPFPRVGEVRTLAHSRHD